MTEVDFTGDETCTVLDNTEEIKTDEEHGISFVVDSFWHLFPSSNVPGGQPHPSTTAPLQHRSLGLQSGFSIPQVFGRWLSV